MNGFFSRQYYSQFVSVVYVICITIYLYIINIIRSFHDDK